MSTTPPCDPGASGGAPGGALPSEHALGTALPMVERIARIVSAPRGADGGRTTMANSVVSDIVVGRKYSAVQLVDGSAGVALTQHPVWSAGCCGDPDAGVAPPQAGAAFQGYIGRSSAELVENLRSPDSVTAAVALAAVNALVNRADVPLLPGDLLEYLAVRPEDIVGMVGFFGPLVRPLRSRCRHLHIFERRDEGDCLPADEAYEVLPKCDIAIITSGTITNGSIDGLLAACASCREVAMVGASTPMLPSAFADTPVTWLSGSVVADVAHTVEIVAAGGGRKEFNRYLTKGNLRAS